MLNSESIKSQAEQDLCSVAKPSLIDKLSDNGWSTSEISEVESMINFIFCTEPITIEEIEQIEKEEIDAIRPEIVEVVTEFRSSEKERKETVLQEAHEVYNSKRSLSLSEPIASEPKTTSPVNMDDANYSTNEDYPESYGFIDSIKNWFKVNKAKRKAELVMASGTMIKTDADGNVTMYIKGSLKQIIDGDYYLEVKGNRDVIVKQSKYEHVGGEVDEKFDGNHNTTVGGDRFEKATTIHHN